MSDFFNLNPKVATALAAIIGLVLVDDLNVAEQSALGNWLMLISQTITTNAATQNLIETRAKGQVININSDLVKDIYNPVFYDIKVLRELLKDLYPEQINVMFNDLRNRIDKIEKIINEIYKN